MFSGVLPSAKLAKPYRFPYSCSILILWASTLTQHWRIWRFPLLLLAGMLFLSGCSNNLAKKDQADASDDANNIIFGSFDSESPTSGQPLHTLSAPASDVLIWQRLIDGFQLSQIQHPLIEKEIREFSQRSHSLGRQLGLAQPYLYYLVQEVQKNKMPTEIVLLPGIESGYRGDVYSRHGAAGVWQFMPATGKYFGLRQDAWFDARQDFPKATEAALRYLRKLHKRFDNDWLLAIAAYNAGGGTVSRAIRKNLEQDKPIDFWSLELPDETEQYVPRLLALAKLIGHAEKYGLTLPDIANKAHVATVRINKQLDVKIAAQLAGISTDELLTLNPGIKRWATHPDNPHDLLLPVDKAEGFRTKLAQLPADQWVRTRRHHIVRGDSLNRIARQYGISVKELKQANRLSNNNIRAGHYLTIPLSGNSTVSHAQKNRQSGANKKVQYQVVKGDSLYRIARQFSVQVSDLKKWNRLNGTYIKPGQELTVLVN